MKLYGGTVFETLKKTLGEEFWLMRHAWVDSSPSNGLLSYDPYVKLWHEAGGSGDDHYYNYGMDCENSDGYPVSHFVSEFGF
jgi:hypothetical protein